MNALTFIKERLQRDNKYEVKYFKKNSAGKAPRTHGGKLRGTGYTRSVHEQSKVRRKMERASRKINYRFYKRKR